MCVCVYFNLRVFKSFPCGFRQVLIVLKFKFFLGEENENNAYVKDCCDEGLEWWS